MGKLHCKGILWEFKKRWKTGLAICSALPWCLQAGQPSVCHTHAYSLGLDFLASLPPLQGRADFAFSRSG